MYYKPYVRLVKGAHLPLSPWKGTRSILSMSSWTENLFSILVMHKNEKEATSCMCNGHFQQHRNSWKENIKL